MENLNKFEKWVIKNLGEYLEDIHRGGANQGWGKITYTSELVKVHDEFEEDIYNMLYQLAYDCGYKSIEHLLESSKNFDSMMSELDSKKELYVWAAVELVVNDYMDHKSGYRLEEEE
jgi:hypothetical protein